MVGMTIGLPDLSRLLPSYSVAENDRISIPSLILLHTEGPFILSAITALKNTRKAGVQKIFGIILQRYTVIEKKKGESGN